MVKKQNFSTKPTDFAFKNNIPTDLSSAFKQFGDSYIDQIDYGGFMTATVNVAVDKSDEGTDIQGQLTAMFNTMSLNIEGSAKGTYKDYKKLLNRKIETTISIQGGYILNKLPTTIEELIVAARNFPMSVGTNDVPIAFYTIPFAGLNQPMYKKDTILAKVRQSQMDKLSGTYFRVLKAHNKLKQYKDKMLRPTVIPDEAYVTAFNYCDSKVTDLIKRCIDILIQKNTSITDEDATISAIDMDSSKLILDTKYEGFLF